MKYTKPEVNDLGDAARVIQQTFQKINGSVTDPQDPTLALVNPAYDLDE